MLRKIVMALILVPLAIALIAFAVANRRPVLISFDPFDLAHPAVSLELPLFAVLLAFLLGGVVVGGAAAWLRQGKWRRAARLAQGEARELRAELDRLRRQAAEREAAAAAPRLTIAPPAA
jgi:uncharacterized integral membrane protein